MKEKLSDILDKEKLDYSYLVVKPDIYHKSEEISKYLISKDYRILEEIRIQKLDRTDVSLLYANMINSDKFEALVEYLTSGPITIYKVSHKNYDTISKLKSLKGNMDPEKADKDTLRYIFADRKIWDGIYLDGIHTTDSKDEIEDLKRIISKYNKAYDLKTRGP
ncbi:MAG: nucleoside-diphosphate kinase [Candidatus Parvarchaeum sp.]